MPKRTSQKTSKAVAKIKSSESLVPAGRAKSLAPKMLCWECAADSFTFKSTDELQDLTGVIGQDRAVDALRRERAQAIVLSHAGGLAKTIEVERLLDRVPASFILVR